LKGAEKTGDLAIWFRLHEVDRQRRFLGG
jgi:hypothetical protein